MTNNDKKNEKKSEYYSRRLYNPLYMHDLYCLYNVLILYIILVDLFSFYHTLLNNWWRILVAPLPASLIASTHYIKQPRILRISIYNTDNQALSHAFAVDISVEPIFYDIETSYIVDSITFYNNYINSSKYK